MFSPEWYRRHAAFRRPVPAVSIIGAFERARCVAPLLARRYRAG
jgi:hypothetical protein